MYIVSTLLHIITITAPMIATFVYGIDLSLAYFLTDTSVQNTIVVILGTSIGSLYIAVAITIMLVHTIRNIPWFIASFCKMMYLCFRFIMCCNISHESQVASETSLKLAMMLPNYNYNKGINYV